ncbi:MAG TPA: serine/threonine-protein kinase [Polyangia bacterium]|nr:serine/threonine-protein kinase [Polyangia bacterium]
MLPAFTPTRFGQYQLTAHLGRGGMADVFRAVATGAAGFERIVVVKKILGPYNDDPSFVSMFINEAKIAAQLTHPNIVQVYELGEVDGEYFMAMEYVKGLDLVHALRWLAKSGERRSFPPEAAAYIAREICRGLACAHEHTDEHGAPQPIIHRDVSPHNIMLTYDGQVKLLDFGIAKAMFSAREETRTGALKGKIAYMSPEQTEGGSPGPESDLFATGVVLYEMLVGKRLFKGENDFETLQRVKTMVVPPPSRLASGVPRELDEVTLRALERDRSQRYRRAGQMARDLDGYLQGARFGVDDMAEFMTRTFPPEAREEVPDGQAAGARDPSGGSSKVAVGTNPGTPHARVIAGKAAAGTSRRWETLIAACVGGLVFLGGAWAITRWARSGQSNTPVIDPNGSGPAIPPFEAAPDMATPPPAHATAAGKHPHSTGKKPAVKPKIENFDDDKAPAKKPKIETFDD